MILSTTVVGFCPKFYSAMSLSLDSLPSARLLPNSPHCRASSDCYRVPMKLVQIAKARSQKERPSSFV